MNLAAYTEQQADRLRGLLAARGQTVTFAESCTGGGLAAAFTANPGSSAVLKQAYVTYCDEAKAGLLGVSRAALARYTAVSAQVAAEMAQGARRAAGADLAVSVTGLAGPDGDGVRPVGLVYVGAAYGEDVRVMRCHFVGGRAEVRAQAAVAAYRLALEIIR